MGRRFLGIWFLQLLKSGKQLTMNNDTAPSEHLRNKCASKPVKPGKETLETLNFTLTGKIWRLHPIGDLNNQKA